jgi:rfaE bifunctional protein nucleotidyltransferase chain/domain
VVTNPATTVQLGEAISASRGFEFRINGSAGVTYLVEMSTNLTDWAPLGSVLADPRGMGVFIDLTAANRSGSCSATAKRKAEPDLRLETGRKSLPTRNAFRQNARAVNFRDKIIPWEQLAAWRAERRTRRQRLVVTNGCFDLLHPGHVTYLEAARNLGDLLLVGVNADAAVRELKGPNRPVNSEADRAAVLAALESVGGICIFVERTATRFLSVAQPDLYVKGGDYTLETINQDERRAVESAGGKIVILPLVPGKSTTALLEKISRL